MGNMKETVVVNGARVQKAVVDPLFGTDTSEKAKKRKEIEAIRGDLYDIAADALKWNSLLSSMVAAIWATMSAEQRAALPAEHVALFDYAMNKFKDTTTRADVAFSTEGTVAVDKIMEREAAVGALFQ